MTLQEKIEIALAQFSLNIPFDSTGLADEMIDHGYDSPELLMMSLPSESNRDTIDKAFRENGFEYPDVTTAKLILLRHYVISLYENHGNILALSKFRDEIYQIIDTNKNEFNLGEKIHELMNYYWYYDEDTIYSDSQVQELVKNTCVIVLELLKNLPNKAMHPSR